MHPPPPDEPTRGRRGNGLSAAEWGALVDLDPRLSELFLDRLAAAGVAAHVEPAGAVTDPVSRADTMPVRPLDRLFVDVARADDARAVVEAEADDVVAQLHEQGGVERFLHAVPRGAGVRVLQPPAAVAGRPPRREVPSQTDTDAAWRAIVEAFSRDSDTPVPPWPAQEDLDPAPRSDGPPRRRRDDPPTDVAPEPALPGWVEPEALPDEGHYEPPPPPPTPRVRARTVAAWAALVLGLVVLLTPSLLDAAPGAGTFLAGAVLAIGGVAALVHGMRDAAGPDDGPDDGAVV